MLSAYFIIKITIEGTFYCSSCSLLPVLTSNKHRKKSGLHLWNFCDWKHMLCMSGWVQSDSLWEIFEFRLVSCSLQVSPWDKVKANPSSRSKAIIMFLLQSFCFSSECREFAQRQAAQFQLLNFKTANLRQLRCCAIKKFKLSFHWQPAWRAFLFVEKRIVSRKKVLQKQKQKSNFRNKSNSEVVKQTFRDYIPDLQINTREPAWVKASD